jgi:shikimate dehydrogenase
MDLGGSRQRMGFVGVTTGSSSIMRIFPLWADELELPTRSLQGHDVPLDSPPETYRALLRAMRDDEDYLGALVTTHKLSVYAGAGDLFDEIDDFGRLCAEVSSISKRDGLLLGHAKDPITADLAMREFIPEGYFSGAGAEVLCLGSGGAAATITWCLAGRADVPARILCTDINQDRLDHIATVHRDGALPPELFAYELVSGAADPLLAGLPTGSLVINATGLGKDRPGSPLSSAATYPQDSIVWELNYRGSLETLSDARRQEQKRGLRIVDGWRYFIHGWTQVIGEVFDVEMTPEKVQRLSEIAVATN